MNMTTPGLTAFEFESASGTDVGRVRKVNEDSLLEATESSLWLVADGMGGHAAGDFASQTIVRAMDSLGVAASYQDLRHRVADRLTLANQKIQVHARELGRGAIGSTLVALCGFEDRFLCYWSGDSRVYLYRNRALRQVTRDHTEVQALLDAGTITPQEAQTWPRKNVITRAIGVTPELEVEMVEGRFHDGDLLLLCSDGLTEYFEAEELLRVLSYQDWNLDEKCQHLISEAVERGGKDNVTVVLVSAKETGLPEVEVDGQFPEFEGLL